MLNISVITGCLLLQCGIFCLNLWYLRLFCFLLIDHFAVFRLV